MPPTLTLCSNHEVAWYEDVDLRSCGIVVAFSLRTGGVSAPPLDSLNLAAHVGDDPGLVNENRRRFLEGLGLTCVAPSLVTAEQIHGEDVAWVGLAETGAGAQAGSGRPPVAGTDALLTKTPGVPLMLFFADCVPVVLVDSESGAIAVVHAGWRGALAGLPGKAVRELIAAGSRAGSILAYIGPHICVEHYEVSNKLVTAFAQRFDTVCTAEAGRLDLGAAVSEDLSSSGVLVENICRLGVCTAEATDEFFSYRASSGATGRHAALAVILG